MLLFWLSLAVGAIGSAAITLSCGLVGAWYDFYIPLLLFFGFAFACVALAFLFAFILSLFSDKKKPVDRQNRLYAFVFHTINAYLIFMSRAKVKVIGLDKLDKSQNYLIICNHLSRFDPMIIENRVKNKPLAFASKPGNFRIPIVGGVIHKCGYVSINRENDREALKTILHVCKMVENTGMSYGIFPEGTRNTEPQKGLLPFRAGALKIAQRCGIPIAVFVTRNTNSIHKRFPFRSTKVELELLEVIDAETVKTTSTVDLAKRAKDEMELALYGKVIDRQTE